MSIDDQRGAEFFGLDNVRVRLPIAGIGSRSLAAAVDYLLLAIVMLGFVIVVALTLAFSSLASDSFSTGWLLFGAILLFFFLDVGFFAGQEILLRGQTVGKRLLDIRVVSALGGRASTFSLIVRNLVRSLDVVVGMLMLALDRKARRLGDRLAGTLVVHDELGVEDDAAVIGRLPSGWGAQEIQVIEQFFVALETLPPERTDELASSLLTHAERAEPGFLNDVPAGVGPTTQLLAAFGRSVEGAAPGTRTAARSEGPADA